MQVDGKRIFTVITAAEEIKINGIILPMEKKQNILPTFLFFFILSLSVFLLSANNILLGTGLLGNALFPVASMMYSVSRWPFSLGKSSSLDSLHMQNQALQGQLIHLQQVEADNKAFRDQFETTTPAPSTLLPARIIGMPSLVPGITAAEEIILDKGGKDNVRIGQVVVYKDNLLGVVKATTQHASRVLLVTNKSLSFTAQTTSFNALGVVKGLGNGQLVLDNVLLSDSLQIGDSVVTKGDQALSKGGTPPGLILGKIVSVEKNPSAIFQKASIKSLVDITKLPEVFILIP